MEEGPALCVSLCLVTGLIAGMAYASGGRQPRPIPAPDRDVRLLGLWVNGETTFLYGLDWGSGFGTELRSSVSILALWENGIAYRGVYGAPIFLENGLMGVPEGLAAVDATALAASPTFEDDRFGRWTEKAGVVHVPDVRGGALSVTREGRNLVGPGGAKWIWLAPVDGLKLDGTYVGAATAAAPEMRLAFRKEGRFEASNLIHALGGPYNNPNFPTRGEGTYEFRKWSLILRFDSGYSQAIVFLMNGEGLAEAKGIVLAGSEFLRR
jgi:hypothetical protein